MAIFSDYSSQERAGFVKKEFIALIKSIFEYPEKLKAIIETGKLSNEQCKPLLVAINSLNTATCVCCRKLDQSKIKLAPVARELDPLIDIAFELARQKKY
jgi:hypothetical protein